MVYMQDAMRDATLNVFYAVLIFLFFIFSIKVGEIFLEILEESDLSAPSGDSDADGHK